MSKANLVDRLKGFIGSRLHAPKESKKSSYSQHDSEYQLPGALERHRQIYAEYEEQNLFDNPENRFGDLLAAYPEVRELAVDIGAGAGWLSARLSREFHRVVAIERSDAALSLAIEIFPKESHGNIEWKHGFAEDVIRSLEYRGPTLFITGCVLSHLPDRIVTRICSAIENLAPKGSILGFAECWGGESHEFMWHVRTPDWWRDRLASFDLDFFGPEIQDVQGRHKGFHGVKVG